MGYFNEEKHNLSEHSNSKYMMAELANICLEELMFSSDSYVCMMGMNMQGYKRLHRYISKIFYDLYLEFQKEAVENFDEAIEVETDFSKYKSKDLKSHLETWNGLLEKHLKKAGEAVKAIFEEHGYISCTAQKLQKILYHNLLKNERALKKFEDSDYSPIVIYEHDRYLHEKIKAKEHYCYDKEENKM